MVCRLCSSLLWSKCEVCVVMDLNVVVMGGERDRLGDEIWQVDDFLKVRREKEETTKIYKCDFFWLVRFKRKFCYRTDHKNPITLSLDPNLIIHFYDQNLWWRIMSRLKTSPLVPKQYCISNVRLILLSFIKYVKTIFYFKSLMVSHFWFDLGFLIVKPFSFIHISNVKRCVCFLYIYNSLIEGWSMC